MSMNVKKSRFLRVRRAAASPRVVMGVLCAPALFGTLCLVAAPFVPLADVATALTPLYAAFGLAGTMAALSLRRWCWAAPAAAMALWPCAWTAPYLPGRTTEAAESTFTVLSVNLRGDSNDFTWMAEWAGGDEADALFFQEYTAAAVAKLGPLLDAFPYRHVHVKENVLGTAIYSRYPLEDQKTAWLAPHTYASLFATVTIDGRAIRLVNIHAPPPTRAAYFDTRNAALRTLPAELAGISDVIVAGDLNVTPWSPVYRGLVTRAGLDDARRGRGIHGTWPQAAGPFAIPIDHVLTRGSLKTVSFRAVATGSDHRAVLAEIAVAAK